MDSRISLRLLIESSDVAKSKRESFKLKARAKLEGEGDGALSRVKVTFYRAELPWIASDVMSQIQFILSHCTKTELLSLPPLSSFSQFNSCN